MAIWGESTGLREERLARFRPHRWQVSNCRRDLESRQMHVEIRQEALAIGFCHVT